MTRFKINFPKMKFLIFNSDMIIIQNYVLLSTNLINSFKFIDIYTKTRELSKSNKSFILMDKTTWLNFYKTVSRLKKSETKKRANESRNKISLT